MGIKVPIPQSAIRRLRRETCGHCTETSTACYHSSRCLISPLKTGKWRYWRIHLRESAMDTANNWPLVPNLDQNVVLFSTHLRRSICRFGLSSEFLCYLAELWETTCQWTDKPTARLPGGCISGAASKSPTRPPKWDSRGKPHCP